MNDRPKYRARLLKTEDATIITGIEANPIDPAACKRVFQEKLRCDKIYLDLLGKYKEKAQRFFKLLNKKNADKSRRVIKLKTDIDELKKKIKSRELEVKKNCTVFSFIPKEYKSVDDTEVNEIVEALKKKKKNEFLTADKKIVKSHE